MPLNSNKLRSKLRKFSIFTQGCLVQIFTTRGVVAPPANNLIMSGTLTRSFRHLEHQNLPIISGDIGRARIVQQFRNGTEHRNGTERRNGMEEYSCLRWYDTMCLYIILLVVYIQGVFLLVPPILLEYGTRPPSTQNFCKVPYWPPSTPKLFYVQSRFCTKTAKDLAKFWYWGGPVWDLIKFVLRGGEFHTLTIYGGASKKHPVV